MKIIAERMDIKNLVAREACASVLSLVLMHPYQLKIISHFKKRQDDETKIAFEIPIEAAVNQMSRNLKDPCTPEIEQKINTMLSEHIPLDDDGKSNQKSWKTISHDEKTLMLEQKSMKKKSGLDKKQFPPFDFFGINPKFYINRRIKTVTWVGFLATLGLISLGLSILIIYLRSYSQKVSTDVNSLNVRTDEYQEADLKDHGQLFLFEYATQDLFDAFRVVTPSYYLVTQNTKKGTLER